jgi:hypothetical protein
MEFVAVRDLLIERMEMFLEKNISIKYSSAG